MDEILFNINYKRHAGQQEVLSGIQAAKEARIFPIICSRGWGKTLFATCDLSLPRLLKRPNTQIMWVAPTYKVAKSPIDDVWKGVDETTGQHFIPKYDEKTGFQFWDWKEAAMEMHLFNDSKIFYRSAANPDSIVSKGFNVIVIDEAALIHKEIFMREILPTARRAGCQIFLITTPRGKNWVYELYLSGQDLSKTLYKSFQQPWWKRPDYPQVLIELMRDIPEHIKKQEFDAEFIGDEGALFKNLSAVFSGPSIQFPSQDQEWATEISDKERDQNFVLSVDFAKSQDFTAIVVMGIESKKVYYYARFNKTDYKVVLERVKRLSEQYEADVIYDATGVGSGLQDFMNNIANAYPFKFTNESKNEIVNRLIVACEYGNLCLPNIATMREEFELFSYEITRTGKFSYSAPDGKHDDTVIAVAMANFYAEENEGKAEVHEIESFLQVKNEVNRPKTFLEQLLEEDD